MRQKTFYCKSPNTEIIMFYEDLKTYLKSGFLEQLDVTAPEKFSEILRNGSLVNKSGLLVECGKKWKIVRKILPNSAGNSAEKSEIVRENAK